MKRFQIWVVVALGAVAALALLQERTDTPPAVRQEQVSPAADVTARRSIADAFRQHQPVQDTVGQGADPVGELRLEGIVLDSAEHPVWPARVSISTVPARVVEVEQDGSFVVENLLERSYKLAASSQGGSSGLVTVNLKPDTEPVVMRLGPARAVSVHVKSARSSRPIQGANVELRAGEHRAAITDASGDAQLSHVRGGWYVVSVNAQGFARAYTTIEQPESADGTTELEFALAQAASIAGVVRDSHGAAIEGARVIVEDAGAPVALNDPSRHAVVSASDGAFELDSVAAGAVRVRVECEGYAPTTTRVLTVEEGQRVRGVELVLREGARLVGQVVDQDGRGVADARVVVRSRGQAFAARRPRVTTAGRAGSFELVGLAPSVVSVRATHGDLISEPKQLDLTAAQQGEIRLVVKTGGAIAGRVVTSTGEPVAEAQVFATRAGTEHGGLIELAGRGTVTDAAGQFRIGALPDGDYRVHSSPVGRGALAMTPPAVVPVGTADLVLVMELAGELRGQVSVVGEGVPELFSVSVDGSSPLLFHADNGRFALESVAPGSHCVRITGATFEPWQRCGVEVASKRLADLGHIIVASGRALGGLVVDSTGTPIEGATVTAGSDVLTSGTLAGGDALRDVAGVKTTTTNSRGEFRVAGLAQGELAAVAQHPAFGRSRMVAVPGGTSDPMIELVVQKPGGVRGTVHRAGTPVEGVMVMATPRADQTNGGFAVATGVDGAYALAALPPDDYLIIAVLEAANAPQFLTNEVTVRRDESRELNFDLGEAGATLKVRIEGEDSPPELISLRSAAGGDGAPGRLAPVGANRSAVFAPVAPGAYLVCAGALEVGHDGAGASDCADVLISGETAEHEVMLNPVEAKRHSLAIQWRLIGIMDWYGAEQLRCMPRRSQWRPPAQGTAR